MNQHITPVNNEALTRAILTLHGAPAMDEIFKLYQAIDQAMHFGYQQGLTEGQSSAQAASSALGDQDGQEAFDDGYVAGVQDSRVDPELADRYLAHLCGMDAELVDDGIDRDNLITLDRND